MTQSVYGQHQDAGVGIIMGIIIITQYFFWMDNRTFREGNKP
jgi:hypothetical protein